MLCILLLTGTACLEKRLPLETEARIIRCEDQRNGLPLMALAEKTGGNERLVAARLALAAGRIGDFDLWKAIREKHGSDPVVSDSLAGATLFPGHKFPREALFELLSTLPYTPRLCQALLGLAENRALDVVLGKGLYPEIIAENLWRCGSLVSDEMLEKSYNRAPYPTVYSAARLRRKGIVQSRDLAGASPFTRCMGAAIGDEPAFFLKDPDWRVRVFALRALETASGVREMLDDEQPLVAAEAYAALARFDLPLSAVELQGMTRMQAAMYLSHKRQSPSVTEIYARGGEFARLAAPYMPPQAREEILNGDLPLSIKLAYRMKLEPREAVETARKAFFEEKSAPALQFLLENEKHENLEDVIARARENPDFLSLLIDHGLASQPVPSRGDEWYRKALEKIRSYRGFTLFCPQGEIRCRFEPDSAPLTVYNFIELAEKGYYDHTAFHRVVPAFVCQGGDPTGSGSGGPGYAIRCEYNDLHYDDAGVVGMALAGKDTGGSQFFLTHLPTPHLDYNYTIFARAISGIPLLQTIEQFQSLHRVQLW